MTDPTVSETEDRIERMILALTEQRVIDSRHFGEAPYAPITRADAIAALCPDRHTLTITAEQVEAAARTHWEDLFQHAGLPWDAERPVYVPLMRVALRAAFPDAQIEEE